MTEHVILSIKGLQFDGDTEEPLEMITTGTYIEKDGFYQIEYTETILETHEENFSVIKVYEDKVEVIKTGAVEMSMVFEENQKNITHYVTGFGELIVGIHTFSMKQSGERSSRKINIKYALEMNDAHVSDCDISIEIKSQKDKNFKL